MDIKKELEVIQSLMDELAAKMDYNEDDFSERLGRNKPEIEVMSIESVEPLEDEMEIEMVLEDNDDAIDMDMDMEEDDSDSILKKRLQKLRE